MKQALSQELLKNIYPFWHHLIRNGDGFAGKVDSDGTEHFDASKSAVLVMRMLWAFSAIGEQHRDCGALEDADFMFGYIKRYFLDKENGGVWWSVKADNTPDNTKKQSYAIGFAIYALSQYHLTTGNAEALDIALSLFDDLENHAWDSVHGGYVEAMTRDWRPIEDMRLSDKDRNDVFTMNTHLHILEPYTTLYLASQDSRVKTAIVRLMDIFLNRMYNSDTKHLGLFFNEEWTLQSNEISYGHDIEASWLICEAVDAVKPVGAAAYVRMADSLVLGCEDGAYAPDGSMIYKKDGDAVDTERHWWVQAEAVVGLYKMYLRTGNPLWMEKACRVWAYIQDSIIDRERGEWFWGRFEDGTVDTREDKAGFWKCPYHNSRMCLELNK